MIFQTAWFTAPRWNQEVRVWIDSLKGGDIITSIANDNCETDQQGANASISERRPRDDDLSSVKLNVTDGKHVIAPDAS